MQNAFSALSSGGTVVNLNGTTKTTINPGTYSSITVSGSASLTMNPGEYIINGNVNLSGLSKVNGQGVTMISSGSLTYSGTSSVSLSAPDSNASAGGVPGVLYASNSTLSSSFSGNSSLPFAGVIYYPNGNLSFSGSSSGGTGGCTQVIAGTITISGSSNLGSNCQTYGTLKFGSLPTANSKIALVQ